MLLCPPLRKPGQLGDDGALVLPPWLMNCDTTDEGFVGAKLEIRWHVPLKCPGVYEPSNIVADLGRDRGSTGCEGSGHQKRMWSMRRPPQTLFLAAVLAPTCPRLTLNKPQSLPPVILAPPRGITEWLHEVGIPSESPRPPTLCIYTSFLTIIYLAGAGLGLATRSTTSTEERG